VGKELPNRFPISKLGRKRDLKKAIERRLADRRRRSGPRPKQ